MLKLGRRAIAAMLLVVASAIAANPATAQPSVDGRPVPGYWQPEDRDFVEIENSIQISLINNTGFALNYEIDQGETRQLLAASSIDLTGLYINPNSSRDLDRNINLLINPPNSRENAQLHFEVTIGDDNIVKVAIRRRDSELETEDKAVYIDEKGRVYIF